jgi:hypothetical protein
MGTEMSPETVRDAVGSLYRLVQVGEFGDPGPVVELAGFMADLMEAVYDGTLSSLQRGLEGGMARARGVTLSLAADTWLQMVRLLGEAATEKANRGDSGPVEMLKALAGPAGRIREILRVTRDIVDLVNTTWDPPDVLDAIARSDADFAAGRIIKGQDLVARLRSPRQ